LLTNVLYGQKRKCIVHKILSDIMMTFKVVWGFVLEPFCKLCSWDP